MMKIWHYLNYKCHFYQRKANACSGCLGTLLEVLHSSNMLQLGVEQCGSVSPVYKYVLTILDGRI